MIAGPVWAVVPAKGLERAKSRLTGALAGPAREQLAREMLTHVLQTLAACPRISQRIVVTDCPGVTALARQLGALPLPDPHPFLAPNAGLPAVKAGPMEVGPMAASYAGLTRPRPVGRRSMLPAPPALTDPRRARPRLAQVVDAGLERAALDGAEAALVVMADLPQLRVAEVDTALDHLLAGATVIAPDRHRRGTSALGLRLAGHPPTCFGHPTSLDLHRQRLAGHGERVVEVMRPGFALDVDTPEDFAQLAALSVPTPETTAARNTCSREDEGDTRSPLA